ncbi:sigma factor [Streptomyces sp. NPDC006654]|uniref:sigma factor n=1 Tax=Streptomyces sp. NPDC006654 TaxID=3156897 RepID=UPI0034114391
MAARPTRVQPDETGREEPPRGGDPGTDRTTGHRERHRRPLIRLATRLLGSSAEAEDAVQDAFLSHQPLPERTACPQAGGTLGGGRGDADGRTRRPPVRIAEARHAVRELRAVRVAPRRHRRSSGARCRRGAGRRPLPVPPDAAAPAWAGASQGPAAGGPAQAGILLGAGRGSCRRGGAGTGARPCPGPAATALRPGSPAARPARRWDSWSRRPVPP